MGPSVLLGPAVAAIKRCLAAAASGDGANAPVSSRLYAKHQQPIVAASTGLPQGRYAYVTLLTRDSYLPGIQGLARSMRSVGVRFPLIVIHTGKLTEGCMAALKLEGCHLHQVQPFKPQGEDSSAYKLQGYAECWNKLYLWTLDSYKRLIYVDADMLMCQNADHLFEQLPPGFYAVRDCYGGRLTQEERDSCPYFAASRLQCSSQGAHKASAGGMAADADAAASSCVSCAAPDDYFNAGFLVMSPSKELFHSFLACLAARAAQKLPCGAYAEQDFLNLWWRGQWGALPYYYNAQKGIIKHHPELWQLSEAVIIHYTDAKPWHPSDPSNAPFKDINDLWWEVYEAHAPATAKPAERMPALVHVPADVTAGVTMGAGTLGHGRRCFDTSKVQLPSAVVG